MPNMSDSYQDSKPLKVAVLVSGSGSNLQVLIDAMKAGSLPIEIVGVISNVKEAYAVTRAEQADIPVTVLSHITEGENAGKRMGIKTFERHATAQLNSWQPDLIVLAGFMRVLSADFIDGAPAPMINLHPSLLPKYKGLDTHERVLASDDTHHGCSVHVVTAELDAGQVLTQALLAIDKQNSPEQLQKRVQKLEHKILPWTILLITKGVLDIEAINAQQQSSEYLPALPLQLWLDN
ncbi:phosphoribosylglycinamide formyltransferase [Psychrobacter sp. FDAARGOS_221]|uniref:phosphoribosylglycinamide formyltransferase n=1 Tax=Psychrobacter sp. FDAARGOS_221 TaxID=1975705 RepID=UPI000BB575F2|nr:phosphoribosylglycinamide formyltransferase [Psychrobacter sp. FDAARGOS_221]PNK59759.1 phosphoribosylglycinamide formyltransferase [Psychrobacter sp. FDAARGOS_221]